MLKEVNKRKTSKGKTENFATRKFYYKKPERKKKQLSNCTCEKMENQ